MLGTGESNNRFLFRSVHKHTKPKNEEQRPAGREIAILPKSSEHDARHRLRPKSVDPQSRGAVGFAIQTRLHKTGSARLARHTDRRHHHSRSPGAYRDADRHRQRFVNGRQHVPLLLETIPPPIISANQIFSGQKSYHSNHQYLHRHRYKLATLRKSLFLYILLEKLGKGFPVEMKNRMPGHGMPITESN